MNQEPQLYYIKSLSNTFKATVTPIFNREGKIFMVTINVGGQFESCVNITVKYDETGRAIDAKIPQIYSEPECDLVNVLEQGGAPTMIKASLQFIHTIIPEIKTFTFSDMSKVDCKKEEQIGGLPRRLIMPMPLNVLYIALNGKTWYEQHFNARLNNKELHSTYRKAIKFLYSPVAKKSLTWDQMRWNFEIVNDYVDILGKLYDDSRTFNEFFNAIPKDIQCKALFGWLEPFIDNWIGETYRTKEWVININNMIHVPIEFNDRLMASGGGRRAPLGQGLRNLSRARARGHHQTKPADGYFIVNGD
jgi:hypothetical protein